MKGMRFKEIRILKTKWLKMNRDEQYRYIIGQVVAVIGEQRTAPALATSIQSLMEAWEKHGTFGYKVSIVVHLVPMPLTHVHHLSFLVKVLRFCRDANLAERMLRTQTGD